MTLLKHFSLFGPFCIFWHFLHFSHFLALFCTFQCFVHFLGLLKHSLEIFRNFSNFLALFALFCTFCHFFTIFPTLWLFLHFGTFIGRKYICLLAHLFGFISDQIQQIEFYSKGSILVRPTPYQCNPMFGGPPKMVLGDPKYRVVLSTLTFLGNEARPLSPLAYDLASKKP